MDELQNKTRVGFFEPKKQVRILTIWHKIAELFTYIAYRFLAFSYFFLFIIYLSTQTYSKSFDFVKKATKKTKKSIK